MSQYDKELHIHSLLTATERFLLINPVLQKVDVHEGQVPMRSRITSTWLTCRLFVLGLTTFLTGSSFAQAPPGMPDEQRANNVEPEKPTPQGTRDDMHRLMGPYVDNVTGVNIAGFVKVAEVRVGCEPV